MVPLAHEIRSRARALGFDVVGVTPAVPPPQLDSYRAWLARGFHGAMDYLARPDRVARREDLDLILPGVRSVISVGMNYYRGAPPADLSNDPSRGFISNHAWGRDYHDLMADRLQELISFVRAAAGRDTACRAYVDTGPVLERALAARAGLGFVGKNTCLIHPRMGSWLFLGEVLVDIDLGPPADAIAVTCGTCRRCLDACPTAALVSPRVLDARRCISYLTIELKGPIPRELRPLIGNRIFGCDECQVVCPWQRFAKPAGDWASQPVPADRAVPSLLDLIGLDDRAFRQRFRGSPIMRARRRGLLRNVAVALGNWGDALAVTGLTQGLADTEPLVRGHSAWALGRVGDTSALRHLETAFGRERDSYVRGEIRAALDGRSS
jgi:epoxyqueuosine reductase